MSKLKSKESPKQSATQLALYQAKFSSNSFLRAKDLQGTTPAAASKALARLAKQGVLMRVAKGLYFAPKETLLGMSKPSELAVVQKTLEGKTRPTGTTAANLLGLSTQVAAWPQIVAFSNNQPKHSGSARIQLRRGARPHPLPNLEGALLEFLRDKGEYAETEPDETFRKLRHLLQEQLQMSQLRKLSEAAQDEPPRVRAMLGAMLAYACLPTGLWEPLKASLNPFTRFDFGLFSGLPNAREWQAK